MSYEPTSWQNGDIVTASKLNNIEQGIENLSEAKGIADTLLSSATVADAGKILSISDSGEPTLTPGALMYGSPLSASLVSNMTETDRVYVYTGTETGYTKGNWYYYDGVNWVSGGIYNSQSGTTDEIRDSSDLPTSRAVYNEFRHFIDLIYPVGSLYFSTSSTNPSEYLGGNWIRYAEGKTIFGASDTDTDFTNEGTGGSKVTAYAVGGPNGHNHEANASYNGDAIDRFVFSSDKLKDLRCSISTSSSGTHIIPGILVDDQTDTTVYDGFITTKYTDTNLGNYIEGYGSVFTAKNLPPYVSCYVWLRVADNYSPLISNQNTFEYPIENVYSEYHSRVTTVANLVRQEVNASEKWVHAIFITDIHANDDPTVRTNCGHSQAIAMYLVANAGVDKIVLGGDYCFNEWTESKYRAYISDFINAGFSDYIYPLSGNHERMLPKVLEEDTSYPDSGFVAAQSRATLCNDFLLSKNNIIGNIKEGYYYMDDEDSKTRFLFLNTSDEAKYSVSNNQLRWIRQVGVAGKENDWTLVVFGHGNLYPVHLENNQTSNQVEAKNGDEVAQALKTWKGDIAGYFCGHQHVDAHYVENNIHHVTLYCDRFSSHTEDEDNKYKPNRPSERVADSNTDSAVTVISINLATKKVFLRRIGAGAAPLNFQKDTNQTFEYSYSPL